MTQFGHWILTSETAHIVLLIVAMQFVNSMPAPTKESSTTYVWAFKFLTGIGNLMRALYSRVEKSPNFQDAIALQNGGTANAKSTGTIPGSSSISGQ